MPRRAAVRLWLREFESRIVPTVYTVNALTDTNAGSGTAGDLRYCIGQANAVAGADSIVFDAAVFANPTTIPLASGQLSITDALTITGPTATLTLDANNASRIFSIDVPSKTAQAVSIAGLTLTKGNSGSANGGAILNYDEALTLSYVTISNSVSSGKGGAISVTLPAGSLNISDSTLSGNSATASTSSGGAIDLRAGSSVTLTRCTLSGNTAGRGGAGVYFYSGGTLTVTDSTFSDNRANLLSKTYSGGAIFLYFTTATIRNSTLSGNTADSGGAIQVEGSALTVQNCTIANNSASASGGGISDGTWTVTLDSTIVAKNISPTGADVSGSATANFSLFGSTSGATISGSNNKLNADPLLGPLADNGGPTRTHRLQLGSPCFDAGSNPASVTFDQRGPGFPRIEEGKADIGAVEVNKTIPFGTASAPNVIVAGGTYQSITVTYNDDTGIDVSTLGTGDITVSGPNGFTATPTYIGVNVATNGTPRIATYIFTPPGGAWATSGIGNYHIRMVGGQVLDTDSPTPNAVPAALLGSFTVSVPLPMAIGTSQNVTTTGVASQMITVTYSGDARIAVGTLGTGDIKVTRSGGFSTTPLFDSVDIDTNGTPRVATYHFDAPGGVWDPADNGIYSINIVANQVADTNGVFIPAGVIGQFSVNVYGPRNFVVTNTSGSGPGSFYQAVLDANANLAASADTITFLTGLSGPFYGNVGISITDALVINGPTTGLIFSGATNGAISFSAPLTLRDCKFVNNTSKNSGGAIRQSASGSPLLLLERCLFSGNSAYISDINPNIFPLSGGAISANEVTAINCFFENNLADTLALGGDNAGAISADVLTLESCSFTNNKANTTNTSTPRGYGGAVWATTLIARNCYFSGNSTSYGGALNFDNGTLQNCTIIGNGAYVGGGIYCNNSVILESCIVSSNSAVYYADVYGSYSATNCAIGYSAGSLLLNSNNIPMPGSPCLNTGSNPANLQYDIRGVGYPRVVGKAADIGAYESQDLPPAISAISINNGSTQRSRVTWLTVLFNHPVTLPANPVDAFSLVRQSPPGAVNLYAVVTGNVVSLTFTGGAVDGISLADGRYTLTAYASKINGGIFDGNGDSITGDDYVLIGNPATNTLFRLFGDSDGNGTVNDSDFIAFRNAYYSGPSDIFDFNGDGKVSQSDFFHFKARFNVTI